jgi:NTE family protein
LISPGKGGIGGQRRSPVLKIVVGNVTFDQLQLPFACVATDINTGEERVLRHGAVAEAVRGSLFLAVLF